ncbi:hypothetical protein SH16_00299, partial [Aeromonas caviae]
MGWQLPWLVVYQPSVRLMGWQLPW